MKEDIMKEEKALNVYEKILKIQTDMKTVQKNLKVDVTSYNSYKAVSERDVLDAVKELEEKYKIYSYPYERKIIENNIVSKVKTYKGEETTTNSYFMRIETIYRFVNIENSNEYIDVKTYGDGIDTGDKAPGKAMTYADKYALMKTYKISTGEDNDAEPSPNEGYKKQEEENKVDLVLLSRVMSKMVKTGTDWDIVLETYKKKDYNELNEQQLHQIERKLDEKLPIEEKEVF